MSFKFNWKFFDVADLKARTQEAVTESIAQTRRPPVIAAPIRAVDIQFGTQPPDLAFREIPTVSLARTHIVFHLKYTGDASITLDTAIEANPLREPLLDSEYPQFVKPRLIAALDRLMLPFRLTLEQIVLDTLVDVVYTPQGVLVNFHEDPVKQIKVISSLDMLPGVNSMISSVLKQQLTASFYEDIPESVWASTSPTKTPPDPFRGARRWSQHLQTFKKFASSFIPQFSPAKQPKYLYYRTLSLANTAGPQLNPPIAIMSRGSLKALQCSREHFIPTIGSDHMSQFLLEMSTKSVTSTNSSAILPSSHATSLTSRSKKRPKRRVISLRGLMDKPSIPASNAGPDSPASDTIAPKAVQNTLPAAKLEFHVPKTVVPDRNTGIPYQNQSKDEFPMVTPPYTPKAASNRPAEQTYSMRTSPIVISSRHINGTHSNPQSLPQTPEFQPAESAILEDVGNVPPLPASWDQRRFSTPTNQTSRTLRLPRTRATSMQPTKTAQPKVANLLRSPGRVPSTNDLR